MCFKTNYLLYVKKYVCHYSRKTRLFINTAKRITQHQRNFETFVFINNSAFCLKYARHDFHEDLTEVIRKIFTLYLTNIIRNVYNDPTGGAIE